MADPLAVRIPRPRDEAARLVALHRTQVLHSPPEQLFDELVELAAQLAGTPIASLNLVDEHELVAKATVGLPREAMRLRRDAAACSWTILGETPLQWSLQTDPRTRHVPEYRSGGMHSYAGAPVRDGDGLALGALCVVDTEAHVLDGAQLAGLSALARQAWVLLEWRLGRTTQDQP